MASREDLIASAEALLASVKQFDDQDRTARLNLLGKIRVLYDQVETPVDNMIRRSSGDFGATTALNVMLDLGVFNHMPKDGSITAKELAAKTGQAEMIIVRFMRFLAAEGIIASKGEDVYAHTANSLVYTQSKHVDFFKLGINMMPNLLKIPPYLACHTPSDLVDLRKTIYSWANGAEGTTFYEYMLSHPAVQALFSRAMMTQEEAIPFLGMYPFSQLGSLPADGRPAVVDIGGGRGQALIQILTEAPSLKGRMILQDQDRVLKSIPDENLVGIQKMEINFWVEQPVKNAHIYYLRRIMHNYQDGDCVKILNHIADAMLPDSRLFIGELIVPTIPTLGKDTSAYWLDIIMMVIGGKERTEREFSEVLEQAGLKLVKIWTAKVGPQVVLECCLANA